MRRDQKEQQVRELSEAFNNYDSYYLVDFLNMSVDQAMELRKRLRENSYIFRVVKNRLALRALHPDSPQELREHFQGLTAIAFAPQNPVGLARLIKNFSEQNKILNVKAGLVEGQYLDSEKFDDLVRLGSREELIVRLGSLMASPLLKLLRTWQAPLSGLGTLLSQLKTKK